MAYNMLSSQPMPLFVIDTCPSNDNQELLKTPKQSNSNILRSWSLPNCNETYKDLCGAVHYSFFNRLNNIFKRSHSYPNNLFLKYLKPNEKYSHIQSPSTSIHINMNLLDPNGGGTQTPGGSSSRYSLYGSYFDLSESGYYPPSDQQFIKSDNKLLTIDGRPLLIVDHSTRLSTNTYQDKCTDWLRHLNTNST
jgi:hypothetical protein